MAIRKQSFKVGQVVRVNHTHPFTGTIIALIDGKPNIRLVEDQEGHITKVDIKDLEMGSSLLEEEFNVIVSHIVSNLEQAQQSLKIVNDILKAKHQPNLRKLCADAIDKFNYYSEETGVVDPKVQKVFNAQWLVFGEIDKMGWQTSSMTRDC